MIRTAVKVMAIFFIPQPFSYDIWKVSGGNFTNPDAIYKDCIRSDEKNWDEIGQF